MRARPPGCPRQDQNPPYPGMRGLEERGLRPEDGLAEHSRRASRGFAPTCFRKPDAAPLELDVRSGLRPGLASGAGWWRASPRPVLPNLVGLRPAPFAFICPLASLTCYLIRCPPSLICDLTWGGYAPRTEAKRDFKNWAGLRPDPSSGIRRGFAPSRLRLLLLSSTICHLSSVICNLKAET